MMHPMLAFTLYLSLGSLIFFIILLISVRVSVYVEENCPTSFCKRRKQREMEKKFIRRILCPEEGSPHSIRAASPSQDNITAEIVCQNYIYGDAHSTGLTGSEWLTAVVAYPSSSSSSSLTGRTLRLTTSTEPIPNADSLATNPSTNVNINIVQEEEEESPEVKRRRQEMENLPPPPYHHFASEEDKDEPPPPSYAECMKNSKIATTTNPATCILTIP